MVSLRDDYEWNLYKCKELQICFMEGALPN